MTYGWKVCGVGPIFDPDEHEKRGCHWYHDGTGPPCTCDLPVRHKAATCRHHANAAQS